MIEKLDWEQINPARISNQLISVGYAMNDHFGYMSTIKSKIPRDFWKFLFETSYNIDIITNQ